MRYLNRAAFAAFLLFLSSASHSATPLKPLSDLELDGVSAGYLTVEVIAVAEAFGPVTEAYTFTDSTVRQLEDRGDGYLYTKGEGYALAIAKGNEVFTFADGMVDTDEEIVSMKVMYRQVGKPKKGKKHKKRKNKSKKTPKNKPNPTKQRLVKQKSVYKVRVVTRVPKPAS